MAPAVDGKCAGHVIACSNFESICVGRTTTREASRTCTTPTHQHPYPSIVPRDEAPEEEHQGLLLSRATKPPRHCQCEYCLAPKKYAPLPNLRPQADQRRDQMHTMHRPLYLAPQARPEPCQPLHHMLPTQIPRRPRQILLSHRPRLPR